LTGALQPNYTPLEDPVLQRAEGQPPLRPTGKNPCLRIFPGDDFIRIFPIFFKTSIKFVQLLLGDGNFVGIGLGGSVRPGQGALSYLPEQTSIALEMRCYTERIFLMAQALTFDGITCRPATYAEHLFAITDRNAG
jgi:hypothetical protein